jgi:hypothetical protein
MLDMGNWLKEAKTIYKELFVGPKTPPAARIYGYIAPHTYHSVGVYSATSWYRWAYHRWGYRAPHGGGHILRVVMYKGYTPRMWYCIAAIQCYGVVRHRWGYGRHIPLGARAPGYRIWHGSCNIYGTGADRTRRGTWGVAHDRHCSTEETHHGTSHT